MGSAKNISVYTGLNCIKPKAVGGGMPVSILRAEMVYIVVEK